MIVRIENMRNLGGKMQLRKIRRKKKIRNKKEKNHS